MIRTVIYRNPDGYKPTWQEIFYACLSVVVLLALVVFTLLLIGLYPSVAATAVLAFVSGGAWMIAFYVWLVEL